MSKVLLSMIDKTKIYSFPAADTALHVCETDWDALRSHD